jgi:NADPH-dependent methylglyoxal reductase
MILPTYIGGPNILPLTEGPDSLSLSQNLLWQTATDPLKLPALDCPGWVDVRDVARAHINALVKPEAAGKRWIISAELATYSDVTFPLNAGAIRVVNVFIIDCRYY